MFIMAGIEAVFEFLRKNGLSEAESALRQDIIEKTDLASFDYEKFFFPMVPPPPPVKIRSFSRPPEFPAGDAEFFKSSSVSSEEQFVSIGSSNSRVSSLGTLFFFFFAIQ